MLFFCELENFFFFCCFIGGVVLDLFVVGVFLGEIFVIRGFLVVVFNWIFFIIFWDYFGFLVLFVKGGELDFYLFFIGGNFVDECFVGLIGFKLVCMWDIIVKVILFCLIMFYFKWMVELYFVW